MIDSREAARVEAIALVQNNRLSFNATTEPAAGSALGDPLVLAISEIVDAADIKQLFEAELGIVTQRGRDREQIVFAKLVCQLTASRMDTRNLPGKTIVYTSGQCLVRTIHYFILVT